MKTGDKVRCVNDIDSIHIQAGSLYTIVESENPSDDRISLQGIPTTYSFYKSRFVRELQPFEYKCLFVEQGSISTIRLPSGDMAIRDPHNISIIDNRDLNDLFDCLCKMYPDLLKRVDK